jgi:3-oxoacyl-[acyl-carrier-protein] synthase II
VAPRVVVTGMDVATAIGIGLDAYWKAVLAGVSGVRPITHFDPTGLPTRIAATLAEPARVESLRAELGLEPTEPRTLVVALAAARGAVERAGAGAVLASPRAGLFVGTSGERQDLRVLGRLAYGAREDGAVTAAGLARALARAAPGARTLRTAPPYLAARLARAFAIQGPAVTVQTACTSSAQALGEALRALRRGTVEVALAGGADCLVAPIEVQLFCLLGVLSRRNDDPAGASRPFDADRDGFVLGEGAGFLLLETAEHARRRGAPVLAELAGYGSACDAWRVTDEAPDGRGAVAAMRRALADAGLRPEEVDYVNAHGTATPMNDRVETRALHAVFGAHARRLRVSSTKSMIGHTISAAGAIELVTTVLALRDQVAPPTINYRTPDPECDLDYVPNRPVAARLRAALSNSFGFGGHNDCLVVREVSA